MGRRMKAGRIRTLLLGSPASCLLPSSHPPSPTFQSRHPPKPEKEAGRVAAHLLKLEHQSKAFPSPSRGSQNLRV